MPTSLIAPLVTAGLSLGANALFGPKSSGAAAATAPLTTFQPSGISAGGLTSSTVGNNIGITADPSRTAAVGDLASTFGTQADQIGALRGTVAPGFSDLRAAGLNNLENARQSAIGNLRDNLQRRRVLGSSFAQDAASRTEAEFGQQKANFAAQSYLQELEATNQLMQQEFTARRGQFQTGLDEMNLEANLAAGLAGKATDVLSKNAQIEAQLNALQQQGQGKLIGSIVQPFASSAGTAAGKFFTNDGSAGTLSSLSALGSGGGPIASPF